MELLFLDLLGMAAFAGPAKPLLALNPQEDAKFNKQVAQVRRRATKVSGCRGVAVRGSGRRSLGSPRDLAPSLPRHALCSRVTPTSRACRPRKGGRFMLIGK